MGVLGLSAYARIEDISPGNLPLFHELKHVWQFRQFPDFEGRVDVSLGIEIDRLLRVEAVADVRAFDGDHADDGGEDVCGDTCMGREADADDGSAGAAVLAITTLSIPSPHYDGKGKRERGGGGVKGTLVAC